MVERFFFYDFFVVQERKKSIIIENTVETSQETRNTPIEGVPQLAKETTRASNSQLSGATRNSNDENKKKKIRTCETKNFNTNINIYQLVIFASLFLLFYVISDQQSRKNQQKLYKALFNRKNKT